MTIPGYFADAARAAMIRAGGDPENSGPLAAWAHAALDREATLGVVVAEDGTLVAETTYYLDRGTYVTAILANEVPMPVAREVGMALPKLRQHVGQRLVHMIRREVVAAGSGASVARRAAR